MAVFVNSPCLLHTHADTTSALVTFASTVAREFTGKEDRKKRPIMALAIARWAVS